MIDPVMLSNLWCTMLLTVIALVALSIGVTTESRVGTVLALTYTLLVLGS